MRSSKNRSRNKQNNRPRTLGNIINRVFDSSGPEGKVRGTPQQIIEKYQMLARDAQLSNDRVAAENFLQHAEHYTRLLAEAMREMAAEQEARQQAHGQNGGRERGEWRVERDNRPEGEDEAGYGAGGDAFAVVDADEQPVVEFPEAQIRREDRPREERPRDDRRRDERPRDERPRDDRPREERPRDDRRRDDRPREERPQREDRRREFREPRETRVVEIVSSQPVVQPELPSFITGQVAQTSEAFVPSAGIEAIEAPTKPRRAPRKPKPENAAE